MQKLFTSLVFPKVLKCGYTMDFPLESIFAIIHLLCSTKTAVFALSQSAFALYEPVFAFATLTVFTYQ